MVYTVQITKMSSKTQFFMMNKTNLTKKLVKNFKHIFLMKLLFMAYEFGLDDVNNNVDNKTVNFDVNNFLKME